MKIPKIFFDFFLLSFFAAFAIFAGNVFAQSEMDYPIPELGNCKSKSECKTYCDNPSNIDACADFALKRGLMSQEDAEKARSFAKVIKESGGPGGCTSPGSCKSYCNNIHNFDECINFAERNGYSGEHVEEGRKISNYLKAGGSMPGGCRNEQECEAYCSDFSHMEECISFAEAAGIAIKDDHGEAMNPGQIRKIHELMQKGETPGGCKSKNECDAYCGSGDNFEECAAFAEKAGLMTIEEAEMLRKTGGKGPGGCRGRSECEAFCSNPANQEECTRFMIEHDLLGPEDKRMMQESADEIRNMIRSLPPEVKECLRNKIGSEVIGNLEVQQLMIKGREIELGVHECFEEYNSSGKGRQDMDMMFSETPAEVMLCVRGKMGADFEKMRTGRFEGDPREFFDQCVTQYEKTRSEQMREEQEIMTEQQRNREEQIRKEFMIEEEQRRMRENSPENIEHADEPINEPFPNTEEPPFQSFDSVEQIQENAPEADLETSNIYEKLGGYVFRAIRNILGN